MIPSLSLIRATRFDDDDEDLKHAEQERLDLALAGPSPEHVSVHSTVSADVADVASPPPSFGPAALSSSDEKPALNVVHFESKTGGEEGEFGKEPVVARAGVVQSSLSRELNESGMLRTRREEVEEEGPVLVLRVHTHVNADPVVLRLQGPTTVQDVVDMALQQYDLEDHELELGDDSDQYELRFLEEEDGTPDMDLDSLERTRDIHAFNTTAVALVRVGQSRKESEDSDEASPVSQRLAHAREVSIDINRLRSDEDGRILMRVHIADAKEAVVLQIARAATLEELLLQLFKKKPNLNQQLHQWTFVHMDPKRGTLEMSSRVQEVGRDEIRLREKLPDLSKPKLAILPSEGSASPDEFIFDRETACKYTIRCDKDECTRKEAAESDGDRKSVV